LKTNTTKGKHPIPVDDRRVVEISSATLTKDQESVLKPGPNFAVPPRKTQTPHLLAAIEKSLWKLSQSEANVIRTKIMTEKLKRCLRSQNIKMVSKPIRNTGDVLGSTTDSINTNLL